MTPTADPPDRRGAGASTLYIWVVLALIVYASLYPFELSFQKLAGSLHDGWLMRMFNARSAPVDTVANLFFYIPLGFMLMLRLPQAWSAVAGIALCTAVSVDVSFALEVAQHATATRTPSLLDVALNTISGACGAALALGYPSLRARLHGSSWLRQGRIGPVPAILLVAWISLHAAPFMPRLGLYRAWASLGQVRSWEWTVAGSALWMARHLLFATLLRVLFMRNRFWPVYLVALAGSLSSQILFVRHQLEPDELIGAALALPFVAILRAVRTEKTLGAAWWLAVTAYVVSALAPFEFSNVAQQFHWLPFTAVFESGVQSGFFSLTGKTFVYLGLLWIAARMGVRPLAAACVLFLIAMALELLQVYLPDRAAELTDPVLVLLPAVLIAGLTPKQKSAAAAGTRAP
jgi:VanZ family protein